MAASDGKRAGATALEGKDRIRIKQGLRLQWEEAQDAYVLLYPEGMVRLNEIAGEILHRCQDEITVSALIDSLMKDYEAAPEETDDAPGQEKDEASEADGSIEADVLEFLGAACARGWLSVMRHA